MSELLKVLVSGRSGQVGSAISEAEKPTGIEFSILGRPQLDITKSDSIETAFKQVRPDLVINAAAYTAVDSAESDAENAERLNAEAAGLLAAAAAVDDIPIIHLSTDYVFDGTKTSPYNERDPVAPLGVYGRSKLAGEQKVASANPQHLILRTAWVYSVFGSNFVKTMLRVAQSRNELGVVADQIGNPTSAHDIASCLIAIVSQYRNARQDFKPGTYHMTGAGSASWADFAEFIFEVSSECNGPTAKINRITSEEWPTPVTRPENSRLDCSKLQQTFGLALPDWRESTRTCIQRLIQKGTIAS
ncbi:MAG: dTDP-4-dehydrorhamnose reductase [Pseudomonadota bacterium]